MKNSILGRVYKKGITLSLALMLGALPLVTINGWGPVAAADGLLEAAIGGVASYAYVSTALTKLDEKGQEESLAKTKKDTGYLENEAYQNRARAILENLQKSPSVKRKYVVYVNPESDFNAFMTIGGVMSLNKGALDKLDDNEIAYIMAHEMSHGEHRDVVKGLKKKIGTDTALSMYAAKTGTSGILTGLAGKYLNNQVFTMEEEKKADELGFKILSESPYNIGGAAASMDVLYRTYGDRYREGLLQAVAPNNHPKTSDRVKINSQRLTDYSKGHVVVKDGTVYVNQVSIYKPAAVGRYTGIERAYLMAGKLARLYHEDKMSDAYTVGDTAWIKDVPVVTAPNGEVAAMITTNLNSARAKDATVTEKKK